MPRPLAALRLLALAVALPVAACGGDDPVAPTIENARFASSLGVDLDASTRNPSGLYYRDITVGTGALADTGSVAVVRYSGAFVDGRVFDSGTINDPDFVIGSGWAVPGFEEGIFGMRVGGKRQIIIPPELGYGSLPPSGIPANAILVFTVELLSVS